MNNTNRTVHPVVQGTGPWLRLREGFDTASEAPAALGVGKYVTRAELLRVKHTGVAAEHSPATLGKFAAGHAAEAEARPLAEGVVDAELFPVTMTAEVDGLRLLASLDGLTMDDEIAWETKLWNEELAANVRAGTLPAHYTVQMDQELLVSGANRCLFTCTDGTAERFVSCWYEADEAKFRALIDGWRQFKADLAAYTLAPLPEKVVAEPVEALPAVAVRMDGALVVQSNLPAFGAALRVFVDRVPKHPSTDQEFADTEAACKALKRAEEVLDAAEANALASLSDVEAMRRMVADFRNLARDTRLASEKMVERRKLELKEQAVMAARNALDLHITVVNAEIAPMRLLPITVDWAGAVKGKRSMTSMQDALDTALAGAKIEADAKGRAIRANIDRFKAMAEGCEFLFSDLHTLVHKPADDFGPLVAARVVQHRAAEAAKIEAAEAAKIEAAEKRAREQEAARIAAEQAESARLEALADERRRGLADTMSAATIAPSAANPWPPNHPARPTAAPVMALPAHEPVRVVAQPATTADEPATLALGVICERLGFTVSAAFLADTLHIKPAALSPRKTPLYSEAQFGLICRQLQSHCNAMGELYAGEPA